MARPSRTRTGVSEAAADILGQLGAIAPAAQPKADGKQRWLLPLTPEAKAEATRWLTAKVILDPVKARMDNAKAEFGRYALDLIAEKLFEQGNKPSNPLVAVTKDDGTVDHEFLFQLQDKFKVKLPDAPAGQGQRDALVAKLEEIGFHPSDASGFVDNELDFSTVTGFRSLSELLEGHYGEGREWYDSSPAEKEAGMKLASLVKWDGSEPAPAPLSLEEKRLVLDMASSVTVKAGFFSRIRNYCRTPEQVKALFLVCTPICYPSHLKFAQADSETAKASRKVSAAAEIIGTGN